MFERTDSSALTMGPRRWHSRDDLCRLPSRDESINGTASLLADKFTEQTPPGGHITIGWSSTAYVDAKQVVQDIKTHCNSSSTLGLLRFRRHHITALEAAQGWPDKRFDEVHWLEVPPSGPIPYLQLFAHADIVHVHHLEPPDSDIHPHARHYLWGNWDELAAFWASLYLARENPCVPGLNWNSYTTWSPGPGLGRVASFWATTAVLAAAGLLAQIKPADHAATPQALLLIEANLDLTVGDLISVLDLLETSSKHQVIATGWLSRGYSGCGLRLLRFGPG